MTIGDHLVGWATRIALVVMVVVTGLFTYYQENKSSNIMESFAKMTPPKAQVKISLSPLRRVMFALESASTTSSSLTVRQRLNLVQVWKDLTVK